MKAGDGAVFTTTLPCASQLMGSSSANGTVFPPQHVSEILDYQPRSRRRTSVRVARRVRSERHNPHSIATLRIAIARQLLGQLSHCPFCGARGTS